MSARTILTLANGKNVDLLDPEIETSDIPALVEHVAKEKRFNGATRGVEYSVAEHLCLGSDAILAAGPSEVTPFPGALSNADLQRTVAAYFLCHDLHEGLWKDDTTPKKHAIAEIAHQRFGILADHVLQVFELAVYRLDVAIHEAVGLQWPPPSEMIPIVKYWDMRMLVTEWRDHMANQKHADWGAYKGILPLRDKLGCPWPWSVARDAWMRRAVLLLPRLRQIKDDAHA